MTTISLNGLNVYPFASVDEILEYVDRNPSLLVAINAEKVVNADALTREIVNGGIGYCDGAGAVKAVRRKGAKDAIRIPDASCGSTSSKSIKKRKLSMWLAPSLK